ncbi:Di-copper centre-containing protein [Cylindrobasidium torrendii FP15055 ss-10]|uniref:tyrosinase n=1 Tax=Cylindrobasidium torrendii FP15055 ss-10 TaxID=1314674 RepID=A0A0D7BKM1_9AGAR|nr:Di-copper centre-containing protein [Cylindrobasidium torrendii FP15055 ss-10]
MAPSIIITGAPFNGAVGDRRPNRLDIIDLVADETQFALYIQALRNFYERPENQIDSWYSISGIHGFPYVEWNDSGDNALPANPWMGYCAHRSVLFPTWHRPLMFFFEQIIQAEAAKIAATYTDSLRDRFVSAAETLRQPYWDWASNIVPPDEVYLLDEVQYLAPSGNYETMANPFKRYTFQNSSYQRFNSPYNQWPSTIRQPSSQDSSATDNTSLLQQKLQANGDSIRNRIYATLTNIHTWPAFGHARLQAGATVAADSIEAIHDDMHVLAGGGGHMGDVPIAAFDPIFYLHHCNVDRLLALWQALNPGVWVSQDTEQQGTWTIPAGSTVDASTELTPFWSTNSTYWTSDQVVDLSTGGYSYPDFNSLDVSASAEETQSAIAELVEQKYGQSSLQRQIKTEFTASSNSSSELWEWHARVVFNAQDYGSSFEVLLFLGDVPEESTQWYGSDSYVGARYAWANSFMTQPELDVETVGYIPLTEAIIASGLGSLEPASVTPYLDQALAWRVQTPAGHGINASDVPSLEVTVAGTQLTMPTIPGAPISLEPLRFFNNITSGRIGGYKL